MGKSNNKRESARSPVAADRNGARGIHADADQSLAYLIRIPERENRELAIVAFLRVPKPRCRFSGNRFLVTGEHIAVLRDAGIPFEDITETN